jgi:hypothetical protein
MAGFVYDVVYQKSQFSVISRSDFLTKTIPDSVIGYADDVAEQRETGCAKQRNVFSKFRHGQTWGTRTYYAPTAGTTFTAKKAGSLVRTTKRPGRPNRWRKHAVFGNFYRQFVRRSIRQQWERENRKQRLGETIMANKLKIIPLEEWERSEKT